MHKPPELDQTAPRHSKAGMVVYLLRSPARPVCWLRWVVAFAADATAFTSQQRAKK